MNLHSRYESYYRSLLRAILRGIRKTLSLKLPIENIKHPNPAVQQEVSRASLDPRLYHQHLLAEIKHSACEEFTKNPRYLKDVAVLTKLNEGQALVDVLEYIQCHPHEPTGWGKLIEALVKYRADQLRLYNWRQQYQDNKSVIDQNLMKDVPTLIVKRRVSRQLKRNNMEERYSDKTASQKVRAYTKYLEASRENAALVVRNYIKRLQLLEKLPNPYKLPYVTPKMLAQSLDLPDTLEILPGSTQFSVMKDAYDMEYIESIIKPEVEYRINESYFLKKYADIANYKGPYKVQLRSTMAGIMPVHYLKLPFPQLRELKAVAMDIKRLIRSVRKQFVWNIKPSDRKNVNEKRCGEGYAVRGSGGFSVEEIMYPRAYYERLASDEADWEFRMELLRLGNVVDQRSGGKRRLSNLDENLKLAYEALQNSWKEPLDVATKEINSEVRQYYTKYRIPKDDKVWERRKLLQAKMDEKYLKLIEKLEKLATIIEKKQIGMHSDLFNINRSKKKLHEGSIIMEEASHKKKRGIPERSGSGLGKTLGDYMEETGLRGYKMGEKYDRRLSFVGPNIGKN